MTSSPALILARLAPVAVAVAMLAACTAPGWEGDGESGASCAARIEYDGVVYEGTGALRRHPATTGRHVTGTLPGCDDSGGQEPAEPAQPVRLAELSEVPLGTAFLWRGALYLREDRDLPPEARAWFRAPRCSTEAEFRLLVDWLGVTGPKKPRFDGDLRPPYRLRVHVTEGPAEYVGATIRVHADAATRPALGPDDVEASLWRGGTLLARVECDADRFRALSLRVPAQQ